MPRALVLYVCLFSFTSFTARADIDLSFSNADQTSLTSYYADEASNENGPGETLVQVPLDATDPSSPKTEYPFWAAQFSLFENSNVALPFTAIAGNPTQNSLFVKKYSSYLITCATRFQIQAQLGPSDWAALESLFAYYSLLFLSENPSFADQAANIPASCTQTNIGIAEWSSLGTLFSNISEPVYLPVRVSQFLKTMKSQRGAATSDLLVLYMMGHFPNGFALGNGAVQTTLQTTGTPFELMLNKVTPSLASNNEVAQAISQQVPWEQMGMGDFTTFGYTPVHALLAEGRYTYPIPTGLIPIVGAAMEAADSGLNAYEGRDALGNPIPVALSATLFAANFTFALVDFAQALSLSKAVLIGAQQQMKAIALRLRTVSTAEEAVQALTEEELVLQAIQTVQAGKTISVGKWARGQVELLGQKVPNAVSLLNRSLGYTLESSSTYLKGMHQGVKQVASDLVTALKNKAFGSSDYLQSSLQTLANTSASLADGDAGFGVSRAAGNFDIFTEGSTQTLAPYLRTPILPISKRYGSFYQWLKKFAQYGETAEYTYEGGATVSVASNTMVGTLEDGTRIPLTDVVYSNGWLESFVPGSPDVTIVHWTPYFGYYAADGSYVAVTTTEEAAALYEKIMNHLGERFRRVVDPSNAHYLVSKKDAISGIAEIHWWLANLTPYYRGSSGIADALTKALFRYRGIVPGMWHSGVSADIWAMFTNLENFKNYYELLFQSAGDLTKSTNTLFMPLNLAQGSGLNMLRELNIEVAAKVIPARVKGALTTSASSGNTIFSGWADNLDHWFFSDFDDLPSSWPAMPGGYAPELMPMRVALVVGNAPGGQEIASGLANRASPSNIPAQYQQLGRVNDGYQLSVPTSALVSGTTYSVVATDMTSGEQEIIGQYTPSAGPTCSGIEFPTTLVATGSFFPSPTQLSTISGGVGSVPCSYYSAGLFNPEGGSIFMNIVNRVNNSVIWGLTLSNGMGMSAQCTGTTATVYSTNFPTSLSFTLSCPSYWLDGTTITVKNGQ